MSRYDNLNKDYLISFVNKDEKFRVYDERTGIITTMDTLPDNINKFIMLTHEDNKATDEDLIEYSKNFREWNHQLRFNKICSCRYSESYSDHTAVTRFFNFRCNYKDHKPITPIEYKYFEKTPNSGIQYLRKNNYLKRGYAYDFKNQYALALHSDYMIPTKPGKEVTLETLPKRKDLQPGFYCVKITCENDDFKKLFVFSKHHVYLKESLEFAMKHKKQFDISIELLEHENNAYLYDIKDMVTLKSITDRWFTELTELRKVYPKNRLIKHMLSSVWGHLNARTKKCVKEDELRKLDVGVNMRHDYIILKYNEKGDNIYWDLLDTKNPYKFNIRLKPWITAIARIMTAEVALQNLDHVIRVHTDCVVFSKEMKFDDTNLVLEEKTTGKIFWKNCNSYHNRTTGYKSKTCVD